MTTIGQVSKLCVVITDFNGYAQTQRCLTALRNSQFAENCITVVDHGTSGETEAGLLRDFPEVQRLHESPDKWWAGATNTGVHYALQSGATAIMLLNNDCYLEPDTLTELIQLHRSNPDAVIAPIQRDWKTGAILCIRPGCSFLLGFPSLPGPRRLTEEMRARRCLQTGLVAGGRGVIIPASVFEKVKLFDEAALPHYGADHDFFLRARALDVPLLIATRAVVDIDATRTTTAKSPGRLNWAEFIDTLRSTRSHRNIAHVTALFKKHYPIKGLHWLGVALYLGRYVLVYLLLRIRHLAKNLRL